MCRAHSLQEALATGLQPRQGDISYTHGIPAEVPNGSCTEGNDFRVRIFDCIADLSERPLWEYPMPAGEERKLGTQL